MRVADYIFEFFAQRGVRSVFLVPGGGAMYLVDAIAQHPTLDFVANQHEQASVIAAEAYARINGTVGVAVVTTGPGATNAITGVAGAWLESAPVFVLSGQVKRADLKGDSGLRQRGPQEVDVVSMVRSITKYAVTVMDPLEIRYHLERAHHLATTQRGGPVWLDVPLDVQAAQIDPAALGRYMPEAHERTSDAMLDSQISTVIQLLENAERPLLLAGHGVRLAHAAPAFAELYEALNIPVAVTWPAMDLIPSDHRLCVGRPGSVARRSSNFVVQNSDLIIAIGARFDTSLTAFNLENFGRNARRVIVDVDPIELAKFTGPRDVTIEADAATFIAKLLAGCGYLGAIERSGWLEHCKVLERSYPTSRERTRESGRITHSQVTQALADGIAPETLIVTGSSGLAIEFLYAGFETKPGQRVMHTAGLGAMGYGVPAMVGAGVAYGKPFVGIESDGSLMFNLQELLTIRALDLPVCLFVLDNGGYASIRNTQRNYFQGRYVGTGIEAKLLLADVVAFGKTIGLAGSRISDAADLDAQVRAALQRPRPYICTIELEPSETLWPKVAAIPLPDGTMISMPLEDMSPLLSQDELRGNMLTSLDPASERARSGAASSPPLRYRPAAVDDEPVPRDVR